MPYWLMKRVTYLQPKILKRQAQKTTETSRAYPQYIQ